MKQGIHPKYVESTVSCACGETFQTRSTRKEIKVGVCAKCHPFFTGTQKYLDTAGRVEKFMKKYAAPKSPKKKKVRTLKDAMKPAQEKGKVGTAAAEPSAAPPAPEPAPLESPAAADKTAPASAPEVQPGE
ncbi:MAG: 50S ribosomal protein L31 [Candidatus Aureabacteria bacterium]|nr:50S ribosomal protein L31 [Candidatus Auribacterota bacterium]HOE28364.1 50S ribosomal protein L31 [bacterium]HQM53504.1 50S ribosomal protein L31 [bacterium]